MEHWHEKDINCPCDGCRGVTPPASAGYARLSEPMENVSSHERKKIVLRMETLRESIKQYLHDIEHWNTSVRCSDEESIDPDPDGKLKDMLKSLDDGLRRERVKRV